MHISGSRLLQQGKNTLIFKVKFQIVHSLTHLLAFSTKVWPFSFSNSSLSEAYTKEIHDIRKLCVHTVMIRIRTQLLLSDPLE